MLIRGVFCHMYSTGSTSGGGDPFQFLSTAFSEDTLWTKNWLQKAVGNQELPKMAPSTRIERCARLQMKN